MLMAIRPMNLCLGLTIARPPLYQALLLQLYGLWSIRRHDFCEAPVSWLAGTVLRISGSALAY